MRSVTLAWAGKDRELAAPETPPDHGRAELATESGRLIRGDNLAVMRALAATDAGEATLVYMDPPFSTGRVHALAEGAPAFDDRWADEATYFASIGARMAAARDLLAPHGSLVVHVDPKTSHYLRVLGDEIFGRDAFVSEIVWRYRRWPSKTPNFQRVHDVLLRFRKDPRARPRWTQLYEPLAASTVATWGTNRQRAEVVGGRRKRSTSTDEPTAGVPLGDVWDIGVIAPIARERTGYPTQKPEALLERLLAALTAPGDLVVDPYAGSGTTLAVAARLDRRWIGIDSSDAAIRCARARLGAPALGVASCAAPAVRSRARCT